MAASFGSGLGGVIGGALASDDLNSASNAINSNVNDVNSKIDPYVQFGTGLLDKTGAAIDKLSSTAGTQSYQDFMAGYQGSPAQTYQTGQATAQINNTAAAQGGLLSGANLRSINQTTQDISSTYANNAYTQYLAGNAQNFGQLNTVIGDMFQGIGVGQTATGQEAGVVSSQNSAQAAIAQSQAKADMAIGSGVGDMFSGLGGMMKK